MPITIRPQDGRLFVFFPYSPELVAAIKTFPGRRWHQEEKCWSVADEPGAREKLDTLFKEPAPPKEAPSPENQALQRMDEAMKKRHLSPRTQDAYLTWVKQFLDGAVGAIDSLDEKAVGNFLTFLAVNDTSAPPLKIRRSAHYCSSSNMSSGASWPSLTG